MTPKVAILGGGISGLAAAYYLQNQGLHPVVLEATDHIGGLGADFRHDGLSIERFYHVMLNSDRHLLSLLRDLHLLNMVRWTKTGMGFYMDGRLYPFNTPFDLLRFSPLSLAARLRTGVGALGISKIKEPEHLDEVPVDQFLTDRFGSAAFDKIWKPLLRAKFGDLYSRVPAYWFWSRMNREKGGGPEIKGYIRGGYRSIASALETAIVARGGSVRRNTPVMGVHDDARGARLLVRGKEERYDAVISTLPLPVFGDIASTPLRSRFALPDLTYQGVVNVVLVSRESVQKYYWNAVVDQRFPFQGIVETSRVIPSRWTRGLHLIYAMNYCQPGSEPYERPDPLLKRQALNGLKQLYPEFNPNAVEATYVFRAPYVEPVWPVGYLKQRPAMEIDGSNVYLCTTAHAYPDVNSWNTSVGLAKEVARRVTQRVSSAQRQRTPELVAVAK